MHMDSRKTHVLTVKMQTFEMTGLITLKVRWLMACTYIAKHHFTIVWKHSGTEIVSMKTKLFLEKLM